MSINCKYGVPLHKPKVLSIAERTKNEITKLTAEIEKKKVELKQLENKLEEINKCQG